MRYFQKASFSYSVIEKMKSKCNKKQTINQKINRLSVVFDYVVERGYISSNPCNHFVRIKSKEVNLRRDLKPEEIQALTFAKNAVAFLKSLIASYSFC